jgi:hypothetical protein
MTTTFNDKWLIQISVKELRVKYKGKRIILEAALKRKAELMKGSK